MGSPSDRSAHALIRGEGGRAIAFVVVTAGTLVALLGTVTVLVLGVSTPVGLAIGSLWTVSGVMTAWAVETGDWGRATAGRLQRVAVAIQLTGIATVLVAGAGRGIGLLAELPTYGTAPSAAAAPFGAAAVSAFVLAILLMAVPLAAQPTSFSRRRLRQAAVGAVVVGGIATVGAAAAALAPAGCGVFDFEAERWRRAMAGSGGPQAVRMGHAVDRCGVVSEGMTRARVRSLLGQPSSAAGGASTWALGGDEGVLPAQWSLVVYYRERDGGRRVTDVATWSD